MFCSSFPGLKGYAVFFNRFRPGSGPQSGSTGLASGLEAPSFGRATASGSAALPADAGRWPGRPWLGHSSGSEHAADHVHPTDTLVTIDEETIASWDRLRPFPMPWRDPIGSIFWVWNLLFGALSLFGSLALLAAIPVVNFWVLGYLLEAEGRVVRTGKLSYALPMLPIAPRVGTIVLGFWIWLLPIRFISGIAADARILAPGSPVSGGWGLALIGLSLAVAIHLTMALAYGGTFSAFFRPIRNFRWLRKQWTTGDYFATAEKGIREFTAALKIRHHFMLGLKGFLGAAIWIAIPSALFASLQENDRPGQVLLMLIGAVGLIVVLSWVPFLQARFAAEGRWGAMFELSAIRELYRRSPFFFALVIVFTYTLSLPLYIFKAFGTPQDAMWLVTPIFIISIYPARILAGWAYSRANRSEGRVFVLWRWFWFIVLPILLAIYVLLLFFAPAIGVAGRAVLFEHPALMLPVPI